MDRSYSEGFSFETLVNRSLNTSDERRPELTNLIHSEGGMSFRGFGSTAQHLDKTRILLAKSLKNLAVKKVIPKEIKMQLKDLLELTEYATSSEAIYSIVQEALDLTNQYKEVL